MNKIEDYFIKNKYIRIALKEDELCEQNIHNILNYLISEFNFYIHSEFENEDKYCKILYHTLKEYNNRIFICINHNHQITYLKVRESGYRNPDKIKIFSLDDVLNGKLKNILLYGGEPNYKPRTLIYD